MEKESQANAPPSDTQPAVVLCVDDEKNILSSLKRLFRPTLGAKLGVRIDGFLYPETLESIHTARIEFTELTGRHG